MTTELDVAIVVTALEMPLVVFNVLVTACVVRRLMRSDPKFSAGFYSIFALQSSADILNYLTVTVLQLSRLGILLPDYIYYNAANMRIAHFLGAYFLYFQFVSHTSIAVNRYTVMLHPTDHQLIWRGKRLNLILLALLLLPVPGASLHYIKQIEAVTVVLSDGSRVRTVKSTTPDMAFASFLCSVGYNITTSLASVYMGLRTVFAYRRLTPQLYLKNKDEYRLLVYVLLQFVGQFLVTLYYMTIITALVSNNATLDFSAKRCYTYVVSVLCLSSAPCLFSTRQVVTSRLCEENDKQQLMVTLGSTLLALILLTVGTWTASARCPIGTTQGLSSTECYVYKSKQLTWPQAEAECASYGGHLSSIKNKTHNYFLLTMPNLQCASSYWVGGNFDRTIANHQWAWVDKATFTYRNWATGQPATSKCMIYQAESSGQWKTQSCPTPRPFICKLPSTEQATCPTCTSFTGCPTSKPKPMCDEGWVYFGPTKTCLKVLHGVGTWDQYETKCKGLGGHLATVHSMDEMNFIKELTSSSVPYNLYIWIGYRNGACGTAYTWADGSKSNFTNWGKAQPDCFGGNEHCAHIFSDLEQDPSPSVWGWTRGQWNDLSCYGQAHGGVCAKAVTTFI